MLTNIKSESNAPFLKSPPLAHKIIFFEKSQNLCQKWVLSQNIHVIQLSTLNMNDGCRYN